MKILIILFFIILPTVKAETLLLYNFTEGKLEYSVQDTEVVPIASITKLFIAMSILESNVDLYEKIEIKGKSKGRFIKGTKVRRIDLMKAMLIASDNLAADSLAHAHPYGYESFIQFVNETIRNIGLYNTKIFDASGLSVFNVSTADDIVHFLWHLRNYSLILDISSRVTDVIEYKNKNKIVKIHIKNTNPDILKYNIILSKTGFTSRAGRCVAMLIQQNSNIFGVVVLGFKNSKTRSDAIEQLLNSNR